MENLKNELNELIKKFDQRLLDGNFNHVEKNCSRTVTVEIDGIEIEYWMVNEPKEDFKLYSINDGFVRNLTGLFTNEELRLKGYEMLKKYLKK